MTLIELLETDKQQIIKEATQDLTNAHLTHYEAAGPKEGKEQLVTLYELTVHCIKQRNLGPMVGFADRLARKRFLADYDLHEVQMLFNILEETLWKRIINTLPPSELAEALGLVSTTLGTGKDTLAGTYVSLATKTKAPSLDLSELFKGTTESALQ